MIRIRTTDKFNNDLFDAQIFVRDWAYSNGLSSDESEEKLRNELARVVKEIKTFPLSFASLKEALFIKRARCFFDLYAIEYMVRPTSAKTTQEVEECLLGALVPLKSGRTQGINMPTDHLDIDKI
jgi:hypothetical protein